MTEHGHRPDGPEPTPLFTSRRRKGRRTHRALPIVGYLLLFAVAGGLGWWWQASRDGDSIGGPAAATAANTPDETAPVEAEGMPALDASDAFVRGVVSRISSHPQFASWLVNDNLARRFVIAVVEVAHGRSPESHLDFMTPEGEFKAQARDGKTYVDPATFRRYDALATTLTSLDTQGTAQAFHDLHPLFEKAYRELGLRDQTFDETLQKAFDRMLAVRVPDQPPEVRPEGAGYGFTSEQLEKLSPAEKHLVRMGPENARRVQAKLRDLAQALDLEVPQEPQTSASAGMRSVSS